MALTPLYQPEEELTQAQIISQALAPEQSVPAPASALTSQVAAPVATPAAPRSALTPFQRELETSPDLGYEENLQRLQRQQDVGALLPAGAKREMGTTAAAERETKAIAKFNQTRPRELAAEERQRVKALKDTGAELEVHEGQVRQRTDAEGRPLYKPSVVSPYELKRGEDGQEYPIRRTRDAYGNVVEEDLRTSTNVDVDKITGQRSVKVGGVTMPIPGPPDPNIQVQAQIKAQGRELKRFQDDSDIAYREARMAHQDAKALLETTKDRFPNIEQDQAAANVYLAQQRAGRGAPQTYRSGPGYESVERVKEYVAAMRGLEDAEKAAAASLGERARDRDLRTLAVKRATATLNFLREQPLTLADYDTDEEGNYTLKAEKEADLLSRLGAEGTQEKIIGDQKFMQEYGPGGRAYAKTSDSPNEKASQLPNVQLPKGAIQPATEGPFAGQPGISSDYVQVAAQGRAQAQGTSAREATIEVLRNLPDSVKLVDGLPREEVLKTVEAAPPGNLLTPTSAANAKPDVELQAAMVTTVNRLNDIAKQRPTQWEDAKAWKAYLDTLPDETARKAAIQGRLDQADVLATQERADRRFLGGNLASQAYQTASAGVLSFAAGLMESIEAIPKLVIPLEAAVTGVPGKETKSFEWFDNEANSLAKTLRGAAREANPDFQSGFGNQLASGAGSAVSFIGGGGIFRALGGSAKGATAFSGVMGSVQGASSSYEDAIRKGYTEKEAWTKFAVGAGLGATEAFGVGGMLERLDKSTGGNMRKFLTKIAAEGLEEGTQEAVQFLGDYWADVALGKDRSNFWKELQSNASAGAIIGMVLATALGVSSHSSQRKLVRELGDANAYNQAMAKVAEMKVLARMTPDQLAQYNQQQAAANPEWKPLTMPQVHDSLNSIERTTELAAYFALNEGMKADLASQGLKPSDVPENLFPAIAIGASQMGAVATSESQTYRAGAAQHAVSGLAMMRKGVTETLAGRPLDPGIQQVLTDAGILTLDGRVDGSAVAAMDGATQKIVRRELSKREDQRNPRVAVPVKASNANLSRARDQGQQTMAAEAQQMQAQKAQDLASMPTFTVGGKTAQGVDIEGIQITAPDEAAAVELAASQGIQSPVVTATMASPDDALAWAETDGAETLAAEPQVIDPQPVAQAPIGENAGQPSQAQAEPVTTGIVQDARESGAALNEPVSEAVLETESAIHEAATSPLNDRPEPTQGQKRAGNYAKGHIILNGLDISVENPEGSERSGKSRAGVEWSIEMTAHYGYVRRTEGPDGDAVDVFIKPGTTDLSGLPVFVIDQVKVGEGSRGFDETKTMLGYATPEEARSAYLAHYQKGWKGLGGMHRTDLDTFKAWLKHGDTTAPFQPASVRFTNSTGATIPAALDRRIKKMLTKAQNIVGTMGLGEIRYVRQKGEHGPAWLDPELGALVIDLDDIETGLAAITSEQVADKFLYNNIIRHEIIHIAGLMLENDGQVDFAELWQSASAETQAASRQAYDAQGVQEGDSDRKKGHELFRQGMEFALDKNLSEDIFQDAGFLSQFMGIIQKAVAVLRTKLAVALKAGSPEAPILRDAVNLGMGIMAEGKKLERQQALDKRIPEPEPKATARNIKAPNLTGKGGRELVELLNDLADLGQEYRALPMALTEANMAGALVTDAELEPHFQVRMDMLEQIRQTREKAKDGLQERMNKANIAKYLTGIREGTIAPPPRKGERKPVVKESLSTEPEGTVLVEDKPADTTPKPKGTAIKPKDPDEGFELDGEPFYSPRVRTVVEPGFYSKLQSVLEDKMPNRAEPAAVRAIIDPSRGSGVKPDELKWAGIDQGIEAATTDGKVDKAKLLEYLRNEGAVRFKEVTLGRQGEMRTLEEEARETFENDWPLPDWRYDGERAAAQVAFDMATEEERDDSPFWGDVPDYGSIPESFKDAHPEIDAKLDEYIGDEAKDAAWSDFAQDYIESARTRREEEESDAPEDSTKYGQYTLPGGGNYREVVVTMPSRASEADLILEQRDDPLNGNPWVAWAKGPNGEKLHQIAIGINRKNVVEEAIDFLQEGQASTYTSSHFSGIPNYVAHMRLNERGDGLFIEELQSDRHQAARKSGYAETLNTNGWRAESLGKNTRTGENMWRVYDAQGEQQSDATAPTMEAAISQVAASIQRLDVIAAGKIPDAPFRKSEAWGLHLFKRALRDAVASGKSWVGWTTGDTQNERFDLSKQISELQWKPDSGGRGNLVAFDNDGGIVMDNDMADTEIGDYVGADVAKRLLESDDRFTSGSGKEIRRVRGLALQTGGEGMRGFYDNILPKEIGKYVKQWGATVEKNTLSIGPADVDIWRVNITPAMKEGVEEGQALFSPRITPKQDADYMKAVFDSSGSVVKSAEPITRRPDGSVIPLSERFNPDSDSILFSPRVNATPLTERQMQVVQAVDVEGKSFEDIAKEWNTAPDGKRTPVERVQNLYIKTKQILDPKLSETEKDRAADEALGEAIADPSSEAPAAHKPGLTPRDFWANIISGKMDMLDHWAPGVKDALQRLGQDRSLTKAVLKEMLAGIRKDLAASFGGPEILRWNKKVKARMDAYLGQLLPAAARMNPIGYNANGTYIWGDFNMRAGTASLESLKKQGIPEGPMSLGRAFKSATGETLLVGDPTPDTKDLDPDKVRYQLLRPMDPARQERYYNAFTAEFPEGKALLDRFIAPGRDKARLVYRDKYGPGPVSAPEFNRGSLRDFFGDSPFGPLDEVTGYTPDVLRTESIVNLMTNLLSKNWKSGARKYKSGALRESGNIEDLLDGFTIRAFEAADEVYRRRAAEDLIKASVKTIKAEDEVLAGWVELKPEAFRQVIQAARLVRGLTNEDLPDISDQLNPKTLETLRYVLGTAAHLLTDTKTRRIIPVTVKNHLMASIAGRTVNNKMLEVLNGLVSRYKAGLLAHPFSTVQNFLGAEVMRLLRVQQRLTYATLSVGASVADRMTGKTQQAREAAEEASLAWHEAAYILQGMVGRLNPRWRAKVNRIQPRELFDDTSFIINPEDRGKTVWQLLAKANVGGAILTLVDYSGMDARAKQQLSYAALRAMARVELGKTLVTPPGGGPAVKVKPTSKALDEWIRTASPEARRKAYYVAQAWLFDYDNVPWWLDDSQPINIAGTDITPVVNLARGLVIPFAKYPYNYARFLWRHLIVDGIKGASPWSKNRTPAQRRNSLANVASMVALAVIARAMMDDEDDEEKRRIIGSNYDQIGKELEFTLRTGGRVNVSGSPLGDAVMAVAELFGESEELPTDEATWLKIRSIPMAYAAMTAAATFNAAVESGKAMVGMESNPGASIEAQNTAKSFLDDFISSGIAVNMAGAFIEQVRSPYDKGKTPFNILGGGAFDFTTAGVLPPPLLQAGRNIVDPQRRQQRPIKPETELDYSAGAIPAVMNRIPFLSKLLPPAGSYVVNRSPESDATKAAILKLEALRAQFPDELGRADLYGTYTDTKGRGRMWLLNPTTVSRQPRFREALRVAGMNVLITDGPGWYDAYRGVEEVDEPKKKK